MRRLALSLALVSTTACGSGDGPIRIAVAGPFSQPRGLAMKQAAQLAEREINARGGIGGRPLELVFADDSARDSVAVRVAQALLGDPSVVAVVGHLTSAATIAAVTVYASGRDPLPLISPSASSPALTGISPYFFRVCPSDLSHGPRLARYARQQLGARTAGLIYVNDDYGRGVRGSFTAEFARLGGSVVEEDPALPTTPSLEPYLSRMRRRGGVDVLVLATEARMAELALREMAGLGIRWPVIGGDALVGIERSGPLAEGVRVTAAYLPDRSDARNQAFIEAYSRAYPGQLPDHRGAGAYDIVHLLARGIQEAGPDRRAL
ncbi:MAG TPA: ABC transporter substrate-binding protein, partial [Gemmatimonadales bacterium]|nr:ABC transporter substrate-binding protein [Gemmatimonadales bacterium]